MSSSLKIFLKSLLILITVISLKPLSLTILIIAISLIPLKIALFESTFALVLCTPVIAFLIGKYSALTLTSYLISSAAILVLLYASLYSTRKERSFNLKDESIPFIIFILAFSFIFSLTQKWPDFVSMGERLRDFAILSSVIQSPIDLKEPWMAGYPLNYYAFWYRFGHMLSVVFSLKTWNVYHILQSFTFALYLTTGFRLLNKYLRINRAFSVFFAFLICFGSNLAGIKYFIFGGKDGWWGPSRVIPGAINEFPAWSFLLGDLHPHYLNLPLLPFFTVFFAYVYSSTKNLLDQIIAFLAATGLGYLWIKNSNVWDQPVWLLYVGLFLLFFACDFLKNTYYLKLPSDDLRFDFRPRHAIFVVTILLLGYSLYLSSKNIIPPDYAVCSVSGKIPFLATDKCPLNEVIPRTSLQDMAKHFGIPLFIIFTYSLFAADGILLKISSVLFGFNFLFFNDFDSLPFLIILTIVTVVRAAYYFKLFSKQKMTFTLSQLLIEITGIFSLILIIIPEIIFLNDPYGAEVERMNTIFKIYSAAWFFIHVYAFCKLAIVFEYILKYCRAQSTKGKRIFAYSLTSILIFIPIFGFGAGFFFMTVKERTMKNQTVEPFEQGLSEINRLYPGSAAIIQTLQSLPKGIVLEGQGGPYSYTTMIATLAEDPAFVGWVNHVNLLLGNIPEITRREKLSDEFYKSKDCVRKAEIIKSEGITYVISGPLEKARHPELSESDFSCLKLVKKEQGFSVYSG
jgi:uncharacterized membrane protein